MAGPASIGGIVFPGIERDLEVTADRGITWVPVAGGCPVGIPLWVTAGAERDIIGLAFTAWVDGATAAQLESSLPPAAGNNPVTLVLPGDATSQPIPGFGTYAAGAWTFVNVTVLSVPECLGRKAVGVDLWGYRFRLSFLARDNERTTTPTDTTMPAIVGRKFAAHQIQDDSVGFQPLPVASPAYRVNQAGRRWDSRIMLDCLTPALMEGVLRWYRAVRASAVSVTLVLPFGPSKSGTATVVLREMTCRRGPGLTWDGEIDVTISV